MTPGTLNGSGSTIDFLAEQNRVPPMIGRGYLNTDRTRDPDHDSLGQ